MKVKEDLKVSEIKSTSDTDLRFPNDFSFFQPYLPYYIRQTLEIGGEAYVSRDAKSAVSGLFIWDDFDKTGTIFTRSKGAFDHFFSLKKPFDYLFAELKTEHESEPYDIFTIDLGDRGFSHRFRHEISIAKKEDVDEIERFMALTHPGMNRKWVKVALDDGDKCFTVRFGKEIAGVGWLSVVNNIGSLHSLFVDPRYRNMGIGEDILYARLLWLKSKRARSAFSEISQDNQSSAKVAVKAHMKVSGQIYQYFQEE